MNHHLSRRTALLATGALLGLASAPGAISANPPLDKLTVAGWSKPISEITNLLAEPDKGFFKANGIDLA